MTDINSKRSSASLLPTDAIRLVIRDLEEQVRTGESYASPSEATEQLRALEDALTAKDQRVAEFVVVIRGLIESSDTLTPYVESRLRKLLTKDELTR
jgi:hypothetical protein